MASQPQPPDAMPSVMTVSELNAAPATVAAQVFRRAAAIPRWVDALVDGRPYDDVAGLLKRADELAGSWTGDEVLAAIESHPRIGDRPAGHSAEAALSRREQALVGGDPHLGERLRQGNAAYEERFGRIFLIAAAGRTGEEIVSSLERRLGNDDATELATTTTELQRIAHLRLAGAVA